MFLTGIFEKTFFVIGLIIGKHYTFLSIAIGEQIQCHH